MPRLASTAAAPWIDHVVGGERRTPAPLIGAILGEGCGPEVVEASLTVLAGVERAGGRAVSVERCDARLGKAAELAGEPAVPGAVATFCGGIFERGGAILNGPGGGRYVYDLRTRFELFLKISPLQIHNGLPHASPLKPEAIAGVDLLIVRENLGGIYQGTSEESAGRATHTFGYSDALVLPFLAAAARLAAARSGELTVVTKEGGLPAVARLWRRCAEAAAAEAGVRLRMVDVDLVAYELICRPRDFDVVAAPNLCGDVLSDLAAVLIGSRALSFSGNFTRRGDAVYQTNHGAAHDVAGTGRANPGGQILSLAMLLRESLGLEAEARAIEEGLRRTWAEGARTDDLGARGLGTSEFAERVADAAAAHLVAESAAA